MIYFFVDIYSCVRGNNHFFSKIRIYSVIRFFIRSMVNIIAPLLHTKRSLSSDVSKKEGRIIVSLTSFPKRFSKLWLVLESMLGQSMQPDKIIVWLCSNEISSLDLLPKSLKKMQQRGVEFRLSEKNYRSYNKFYFTCLEYPKDYVITIDDDIVYPRHLIRNLMNLHSRYPGAVCCNVAMLMTLSDGDIAPLSRWKVRFDEECCSPWLMAQGVGGILYPPNSLPTLTFNNELFCELCPSDDDTWLQTMEFINKTPIVKGERYFSLFRLTLKNDVKLCDSNSQEDTLLRVNLIRKGLLKVIGKDPYECWR
ncbi:hypothetical protein [Bacteroides difficilis]|uniref:Glycosyltransferase n=1 Tax=Bacteroides difficilis TaxID=2763021 RepID=A0ABR7CHV0_9BACE|nr:hypothetical protein [Bacteroides difficilis]MBC5607333.1 hypothetical protein [Bacteroides difficilis]